ncbi:hypothetical protein WJ85_17150 [Burkholderia ubonensis]|uniref:hypothetical protein n=1 Tax=Burkholderia ubonensis TaxID=101571 RepID=UPI00075F6CBC|nr:hypothetical protein [Burkholderia ubonensis]KVP11959.1 hypothetical protein WJ85_17150 [Burkholderia ubonensis]
MTDLAAQFAADAGGTSASAPIGLAAQFLADTKAAPATAAPATPAPTRSTGAELARQAGLTARAGVTGITALPAMLGDALNAGYNNLIADPVNALYGKVAGPTLASTITGQQPTLLPRLQPVSQSIQGIENAVGLPQPGNATERIVQDAASAMAGVSPSMAAGRFLAGSTVPAATALGIQGAQGVQAGSPVARAIGASLQAMPGMQVVGSAGAGAGGGIARELGLGPGFQLGAALLGGAAGVGAGSLATAGVRALANRVMPAPAVTPAAAAARADAGVDRVIDELGPQARQSFAPMENVQAPEPVPAGPAPAPAPNAPQAAPQPTPSAPSSQPMPTASSQFGTFQPIKQRVAQAIMQNPDVDPAAAMRAQDFRDLGMQPTLGQITRDPNQFARELNIRGTPTGSPLAIRFNQQNTQLQQALNGLIGTPSDAYAAGSAIRSSLQSIDDQMAQQVSDAYAAARASSGKNLDVPLTGVAQDYAQVLNDFGDKVPSGVRNNFDQLGLMGGTQRKTFTIENAENLLKVINANQSNDPATNLALGQLRGSVKNAILSADDQGGVYAPARQLAAQHFALQEQIPALEAAAADRVPADDFVRRFVINGKTDEVNGMAQLLQEHAPQAFQEARAQIGAQLAAKGFGQNVAGDAPFKPAGFAQQMQAFGPAKLAAFYTPDEINQLNAIGRVGSYMNAFPSSAPVNTSNTASAIGAMLAPGLKEIPMVGKLIDNVGNRMFVNRALAGRLSDATQAGGNAAQQRAVGALLLNAAPRAPRRNP